MPDLSQPTLNQFTDPSAGLFPPQTGLPQQPIATPAQPPAMPQLPGIGGPADILNALLEHAYSGGHLTSPEKYHELLQSYQDAAQNAPSALELQAAQLTQDAAGMRKYADYSRDNPLPPPQQFTAPERAPLNLPGVPQNAQPSPNPIASLGAGIAGLFAPAAAGMFGTEALSGAIKATDRLNAANNEKYKFDLEQSLLKHQDEVAREDAQAKVKAQNTALTNAYTAEQHSANLEAAKARFEAETLDGKAGALRPFIDGDRKAKLAEAKGKAIQEEIGAAQEEEKTRVQVLERAGSLVAQMESIKAREAKEAQDSADRQDKAEADRKEKAREFDLKEKEAEYYHRESIKAREKIAHDSDFTRIEAAHIRANASGRSGTMHHKNPEEESAWQDVQKTSREATHQWNRVTAPATNDPDIDNPRKRYQDATEAQQAYENAKNAYKQVNAADPSWSNVATAPITRGRGPARVQVPANLRTNGAKPPRPPGMTDEEYNLVLKYSPK